MDVSIILRNIYVFKMCLFNKIDFIFPLNFFNHLQNLTLRFFSQIRYKNNTYVC